MFRDHARGITGAIPVVPGVHLDTASLQEFVMWSYDRCNYTNARGVEDELEWREP